jgi:hypothetical protein
MSLSRFFVRSAPLARSAQRSLFSVQAAAGKVSEALGEEPDENNTTPLDADEQMRKEILAEHPHENAEDVIGISFSFVTSFVQCPLTLYLSFSSRLLCPA